MIGILLITHGTLGKSLIHCASHVLNKRPPRLRQLGVTAQDDPSLLLPQARALIKRVKVNVIRTDNEVVRVATYIRSPSGSGYEETQQVAVRHADRLAVVIITLATCITMLRNLAAPEVDILINQMESLRDALLTERDAA